MTRRGILLFASMCLIWGIPYFLIRIAVSEISPAMLVLARTGIGALILMPVVLARGGVAVLQETFTPGMGIGFVLVLAGSFLATRRRQPAST